MTIGWDMKLLEKHYSFTRLSTKVNDKNTLAHHLILHGDEDYYTLSPEIAQLRNSQGYTVARYMVTKYAPYNFFIDNSIEILSIIDNRDSIASLQYKTSRGAWLPSDEKVLSILDGKQRPLAFLIALLHKAFTGLHWVPLLNENILYYREQINQAPVLHALAQAGWTTQNMKYLSAVDAYGNTTAHIMGAFYLLNRWQPFVKDVLLWRNNNGVTVAHMLASAGWTTEDKDILLEADNKGITVAILQAQRGWYPKGLLSEDLEVLLQVDPTTNLAIASYMIWQGWQPKQKSIKEHELIQKYLRQYDDYKTRFGMRDK